MNLERLKKRASRAISMARMRLADERRRPDLLRRQGAQVGRDCRLIAHYYGTEPYLISIGDHTTIGADCRFVNHDPFFWAMGEDPPRTILGRIDIGAWVFIGPGTTFLPGAKVGDHVMIGAGSLVKGEIPSGVVAAGVPARVLRTVEEHARKVEGQLLPPTPPAGLSRAEQIARAYPHPPRA